MSSQNEAHGDEDEIAAEYNANREAYNDARADEWHDDPDNW
jgi:hypothetical protein